jgi:predicted Rossmann-fold nucleotide-binding protein
MPDHAAVLVPRHIGVCGSSKGLSEAAAAFCECLGRSLAEHTNLVIASGGTKKRSMPAMPEHSAYAADWHIVSAALQVIPKAKHAERIQTFLMPEGEMDGYFEAGTRRQPRGRTGQARRFSFVRHLDALIAVAGRGGTGQELALASELGIPILPVPSFGDASAEHWRAYREELVPQLGLTEAQAHRWERSCTSPDEARSLAREMLDAFLVTLPRKCFVIMPFHGRYDDLYVQVIEAGVNACGDRPVRIDRLGMPGDVIEQIRRGLRACDYAIAVLDEMKPNVLYELGVAHAWDKPVILLNRRDALNASAVPFDIAGQQRFEYVSTGPDEAERLARAIRELQQAQRRQLALTG